MLRTPLHCLLPAALLFPAFGPSAPRGGWAVITVEDLPAHLTVGQPTNLRFTVRQHGFTLLGDLRPRIEAVMGSTRATVGAPVGTATGGYTANLTVPKAGEWTVTIHSGFGPSRVTLVPIRAVDAGASAVPAIPQRERGRSLFVAKGCVTCHVHEEAKADLSVAVGPALTGRRYPAEYLARFLANPASAVAERPNAAKMPNLGLKEREIAALVTFLNTERQVSSRGR